MAEVGEQLTPGGSRHSAKIRRLARNKGWTVASGFYNRNHRLRDPSIEVEDEYGNPIHLSAFARLWLAIYDGFREDFVRTPEDIPRSAIKIVGSELHHMGSDLLIDSISSGSSYKANNPENNQKCGFMNKMACFGVKTYRTNADGRELSTHKHDDSHIYYLVHELFTVDADWTKVKNLYQIRGNA